MNILITGATGFIGLRLAATLKGQHKIVGLSRQNSFNLDNVEYHAADVLDKEALRILFSAYQFQVVIHLAALTAHSDIVDNRFRTLQINEEGTRNLLELFREHCHGALFLYASSGKVYGNTNEMPISEKAVTCPTNILGKSKLITELLIDYFAFGDEKNRYCITRIFNIYGEGQKPTFILPTLLSMINRGNILTLGNINDARDYLYIDDLIGALKTIIQNHTRLGSTLEYINIGSGTAHTVKDIISVLQELNHTTYQIEIEKHRLRHDETPIEYADISKIQGLFGWEPRFSLREGIMRTVERNSLGGNGI